MAMYLSLNRMVSIRWRILACQKTPASYDTETGVMIYF